jgi:hypothetical protein
MCIIQPPIYAQIWPIADGSVRPLGFRTVAFRFERSLLMRADCFIHRLTMHRNQQSDLIHFQSNDGK